MPSSRAASTATCPTCGTAVAGRFGVAADRLFSGAIQRGIDRGDFRPLPVHEAAHALMAPMIFVAMHRHSIGACPVQGGSMDPLAMLRTHLDLVLRGLERRDAVPASAPAPAPAPASASAPAKRTRRTGRRP